METRQINLPLDTARRWYEQGGELKEMALGAFDEKELIGYRLPKTWEEYRTIKGDNGERAYAALHSCYIFVNNHVFANYHDTQKHIALMKLHLLRDEYRNGWLPDWNDTNQEKFAIQISRKNEKGGYSHVSTFLTFQNAALSDEFYNNFRELIEQAGDLIS